MLYGHEVAKPASFVAERKRTRIRQLNRPAPVREQVFEGLRKGWSNFQIAREMGKTLSAVKSAVRWICKQERVPNVQSLAKKLQFPLAPSPTVHQRAQARRPAIIDMLLRDCTHEEMTKALGIGHPVLQKDILAIYQQHGIKGKPHKARRQLAQKLGRPYITRPQAIRAAVKEMRDQGDNWTEIATQIGLTESHVRNIWTYLQRLEKEAEVAAKSPTAARA